MSQTDYSHWYQELRDRVTDELQRKVYDELDGHFDEEHAVNFKALVVKVCGEYNISTEREVRIAITEMRNNGIAIGSTSGKPGRWLIVTEEQRQKFIAEHQSRIDEETTTIRAARTWVLPAKWKDASRKKQLGLWA
jgi:hypothetical protein